MTSPRNRPYRQLDVFSRQPYRGNPLAVVVDAQGLDGVRMQQFANWTNLPETTFLLPPTDARADYRVRIFTASEELPFAGHPTLGSAHAWLAAGGVPKVRGVIVQQCGAGLIEVRHEAERLAFAAPPLTRSGAVGDDVLAQLAAGLRIAPGDILDAAWLVNGPDWIGVLLGSAEEVLALQPDFQILARLSIGVIGSRAAGSGSSFEVRTFLAGEPMPEDPATGSFNAGAAQWLIGTNRAPLEYTVDQGTKLGRAGRIHVKAEDGKIWIGGQSTTCIEGTVFL